MIEVTRLSGEEPMEFQVVIRESTGETRHTVMLGAAHFARLSAAAPPECCIEAAFQFLLEREPREAILRRFDIDVISRYFPEFERELPRYLAAVSAGRDP
jgi:hypothetical protein